ncbi:MAG: ribonuclease J [Deltaproteobacteria bacterium]|jgi:ribonuclease J|nr:ribonuclease J [Deltaproteobacteria bacterium]
MIKTPESHLSIKFLGGCEQFGMNCMIIGNGSEEIVVDCGINISDLEHYGINYEIPDPQIFAEHKDKIKAYVITHGHQDHIGALDKMMNIVKAPIYATSYTMEIIKKKNLGRHYDSSLFHLLRNKKSCELTDQIKVTSYFTYHSIPHTTSLLFDFAGTKIFHSGDFKLSSNNLGNYNLKKLKHEIGKVKIMLCDSTGALDDTLSGSERNVEDSLANLINGAKNRIIITSFSSNIPRVKSILNVARKTGKKVAFIGKSMHSYFDAARQTKVLSGYSNTIIKENKIKSLPDEKLIILISGSQGEFNSALTRSSKSGTRRFSFKPSDTFIYSAREIPGNEAKINQIKSNIIKLGVNIIDQSCLEQPLHVSGHGGAADIMNLIKIISPEIFIPIHGDLRHLDAAANLAENLIKETIIPHNGDLLTWVNNHWHRENEELNFIKYDYPGDYEIEEKTFKQRKKLAFCGAAAISIILNGDEILGKPDITFIGTGKTDEHKRIKSTMATLIEATSGNVSSPEKLEIHLKKELGKYLKSVFGKKPSLLINIHVL